VTYASALNAGIPSAYGQEYRFTRSSRIRYNHLPEH